MNNVFRPLEGPEHLQKLLETAVRKQYIKGLTLENVGQVAAFAAEKGLPDFAQCNPLYMVVRDIEKAQFQQLCVLAILVDAFDAGRISQRMFVRFATETNQAMSQIFELHKKNQVELPATFGGRAEGMLLH